MSIRIGRVGRIELTKNMHYVITFFAIMCSGCPLATFYYGRMVIGLFLISFIVLFLQKKVNYNFSKSLIIYICLLVVSLCFASIVNLDCDFTHYFGKIISLLTVLFLTTEVTYSEFCKTYVKIISMICLCSLVFTCFFSFSRAFAEKLPEIQFENAGRWLHFNYLYYIWGGYLQIGAKFIRNSGFFREPGVFSTHICLSMMLILADKIKFSNIKSRKFLMALFFVTGLTTFSTVGVIGSTICFIVYLKNESTKLSKSLYLIIALIVVFYFLIRNQAVLFAKFNSKKESFISVTDRINGLTSALKVLIQNPFFGRGYSYFQSKKVGVSTFFMFDLWAKYGFLYILVTCAGILAFIDSLGESKMKKILYMGVYLLFLVSQGLVDLPIFLMFQLYGVKKYKEKLRNRY